MKISVITPVFNSGKTIRETCESVLRQNYHDYEHLIIDKESSDKTLEIIKEVYADNLNMVKIITGPDKGIADAFNIGISHSDGEIITILNGDDYYINDETFSEVFKIFSKGSTLMFHGDILFQDDKFGSNIRRPLLCDVREAMPYNHPTIFFNRIVYDNYGIFDTSLKYTMDYDLICRISAQNPALLQNSFYYRNNPIVFMRAGGISWKHEKKSVLEMKKVLLKYSLWDAGAKRFFRKRMFRIRIKGLLEKTGLSIMIKIWRNMKWKNK